MFLALCCKQQTEHLLDGVLGIRVFPHGYSEVQTTVTGFVTGLGFVVEVLTLHSVLYECCNFHA